MAAILQSEFLWGVILGVLLTVPVAGFAAWLENRRRRRVVVDFCTDTIHYTCDLIRDLEDNQTRNRRIDEELIGLLSVEVGLWGRNRENMIALPNASLRRDLRDFFTRVGSAVMQIQSNLQTFMRDHSLANTPGLIAAGDVERQAQVALGLAGIQFDKLKPLQARRTDLVQRLAKARPRWP